MIIVFFYYMMLAFLIALGAVLALMLFVAKWLIAILVAIIMFVIDAARGKPLVLHVSKPQAYYSNRR